MQVSPRYTIEDWNFGRCTDIDIAEDQLDGWILGPARALLNEPGAGIAILTVVSPCFEIIESYHLGELNRDRGREFRLGGLARVFPDVASAAREKYVQEVECGFLQGSLFRRTVVHRHNASFPDFGLLPDGRTLGVNPWYVLTTVEAYCHAYFAAIRTGAGRDRFDAVLALRKKM